MIGERKVLIGDSVRRHLDYGAFPYEEGVGFTFRSREVKAIKIGETGKLMDCRSGKMFTVKRMPEEPDSKYEKYPLELDDEEA